MFVFFYIQQATIKRCENGNQNGSQNFVNFCRQFFQQI